LAVRPTDTDLEAWLKEHRMDFIPGASRTVHLKYDPDQIPRKRE
jgi:hypothetical protein